MSKYTTEVRYICEQNASLEASVGVNDVDMVLESSWDKIFNSDFPIFDENYRKPLCKKILKHYYTREIGAETVGLWKLWLNQRMNEIMPYYNQLYESELLKVEPFINIDVTKTHDNTDNTDREETSTVTNTNTERDLFSDTPQGSLTNVENETYLTNARKITNDGNGTGTSNIKDDRTYKGTENIKGKNSGENMSDMLIKFRKTFLNIDMMIINELSDLFMLLW